MYERILHRLHSITKISNKKSLYQCPQVLYIQHNNAKVNILLCRIIKIYRGICCLALDLAPPGIPFSSQINTCHRTYDIFRNLANNKMMEDMKLFLYILPRWTPITDLFSELSHLSVFCCENHFFWHITNILNQALTDIGLKLLSGIMLNTGPISAVKPLSSHLGEQ